MLFAKDFSYKKTTQAINYFATQLNGRIDKLKALKLIYFADRYHLRKYGSLITNDLYFAMPFGPVASITKDILEMSPYLSDLEKEYAVRFIEPISDTNFIKSVTAFDRTELSDSEIDALKYVADNYKNLDGNKLVDLTHKYPEWKRFESALESKRITRAEMDLIDFFSDSEDNSLDKFYDLSPEEKEAKIDYLKEINYVDSLWNN